MRALSSIHRAFAATRRATAETSWQRVSRVLDDYIGQWSEAYVGTCEATHVRGEQSGEVLDLRMTCLADNLDQVRALTNILARRSTPPPSAGPWSAAHDLTPVSRCADVALLATGCRAAPRSANPRSCAGTTKLPEGGTSAAGRFANLSEARARAIALQPRVEATGYRPLLAELLELHRLPPT